MENAIPLNEAVLCSDCGFVSDSSSVCGVCYSIAVEPLHRWVANVNSEARLLESPRRAKDIMRRLMA